MTEPLRVEGPRELDALVAEKILGFTRRTANGSLYYLHPSRGWGSLPDNEPAPTGALRCGDWDRCVARYSTSIAAAWKVAERMVERNYGKVHVSGSHYHGWHAWVTWDDDREHGSSASNVRPVWAAVAPTAIALAALRAVGVEVELAEEGRDEKP